MVKLILNLAVLLLLLTSVLSALAELPSAPPPAPGGFETQSENSEDINEASTLDKATAADQEQEYKAYQDSEVAAYSSMQELQEEISSLEKELSDLKKRSSILSIPFIISVSINIALLFLILYLSKKAREQSS